MADYKRMVSYMYQYEKGIKKKNVGYARIESKNGECKITLHMQLLGLLDSIFPTYLIEKHNKDTELVYVGDAVLKNQVMDSKFTADEMNVMGSGYKLSDMGGMLLFLNEDTFYATEWNDKPIVQSEVLEALKPKKHPDMKAGGSRQNTDKGEDKYTPGQHTPTGSLKDITAKDGAAKDGAAEDGAAKNGAVKDEAVMDGAVMDGAVMDETVKDEQHKDQPAKPLSGTEELLRKEIPGLKQQPEAQPVVSQPGTIPPDRMPPEDIAVEGTAFTGLQESIDKGEAEELDETLIPVYKFPRGWKTLEVFKKPYVMPPFNLPKELVKQEPDLNQDLQEASILNEPDMQADQESLSEYSDFNNSMEERKPELNIDNDLSGLTGEDYTDRPELNFNDPEEEQPENSTAARIFENYPRIYPFEDNEIIMCVKIEPKDIGYLPADIWTLSNNSFLLHGYYCYHHLIFAKIKDRNGSRYILGVPGIFHNRERFMARMFGFEAFKSIRRRELRQGDFGYWYIQVNL